MLGLAQLQFLIVLNFLPNFAKLEDCRVDV